MITELEFWVNYSFIILNVKMLPNFARVIYCTVSLLSHHGQNLWDGLYTSRSSSQYKRVHGCSHRSCEKWETIRSWSMFSWWCHYDGPAVGLLFNFRMSLFSCSLRVRASSLVRSALRSTFSNAALECRSASNAACSSATVATSSLFFSWRLKVYTQTHIYHQLYNNNSFSSLIPSINSSIIPTRLGIEMALHCTLGLLCDLTARIVRNAGKNQNQHPQLFKYLFDVHSVTCVWIYSVFT